MDKRIIAILIAGGIGAYIIWQMMAEGENGNGEQTADITNITLSGE